MNNKKVKRFSLANLITGYILSVMFLVLILLNRGEVIEEVLVAQTQEAIEKIEIEEDDNLILFDGVSPDRVYINHREPTRITNVPLPVLSERDVVVETAPRAVRDTLIQDRIINRDLIADEKIFNKEYAGGIAGHHESYIGSGTVHRNGHTVNEIDKLHRGGRVGVDVEDHVDFGLLDRRLAEIETDEKISTGNPTHNINPKDKRVRTGINKDEDLNLATLTLSRQGDDAELELGDFDFGKKEKTYGMGKGGELYAYNYPSRGVGAGIGSSAVGAGAGGGAGLGAGIGEGMLNGEVVPTLGGVGTGPEPIEGQPAGAIPSGGVGGLVGGAGAGGAAGLTQGYVTKKLGLGVGSGQGAGYGGQGGRYNYEHLPKDGALHIMMHVDGSGSILDTRKQLTIMKDTLLKDALLPYYNNNEDLYNRRVTIVDGNGERTLQFFTEAAKKDNVLAVVFQDEAQPAYHLPTFNKKPQDDYSKDLKKLKASLNGYGGIYRGVMFQVDRGKTFAKSFKEFVESAWRGEGYLEGSNLKKYYRDNNNHHIKNKDGVVFSDEYHAKDSGNPQYYLELIFNASRKVGLDLDIYGAGLTDGKHNSKVN